ncbi:uncharacterized protein TM35_000211340 [Trypanosoma theileri]|uniref:Uncharacterized protein n=1 Tax=Trypanosoma theileri TaxID=67003 RepID=A0A1X0NSJ3_9TRYP|nr:uncharacterized protein TM35_000211340 [Trypanosoma theileri]ORC87528.1 hypothetical protein TM35_000211340 [Trypanosoma theileri]
MDMRGNGAGTGPLTSSTHLLLPRRTPLERRLDFLTDDVVCTLADDQALLAEGLIMAYRSMASAGAFEVREDQVPGVGAAMAAPSIMVYASQLNDSANNHHSSRSGDIRYCNTCDMSEALQLLREVDKAIAWCEGKIAVTAQLFPPITGNHFHQRGTSPNNDDGGTQRVRGVSPQTESASSCWLEPQEVPHGGVRSKYYEGSDGNIYSGSRSRVWVSDTLPSTSTCVAGSGGGLRCNLDFDRWTARQISCQAHRDGWRLLLLRCVAEECVRRHTMIVEERLGRITLLVAAREEVTARVELQGRRGALDRQTEFPACTVGPVEKRMTLLEEGRQGHSLGADHKTKETQTLVSGSCTTDTRWSEFMHALLCESEGSQRVGIVQEAQLSRQLLLAQWQSVVNHMGSRRLLAAKEGRIRELAANHNGFPVPDGASSQPVYFPPVCEPAKPHSDSNSNSTPCRGAVSCDVMTSSVTRVPEVACAAASVAVLGRCSGDDATLSLPSSIQTTAPQSRMRRTRGGGASDIPLHICTSVEGVERKQLALTEQRAWQELTSRLEAEWKRYERQCSRSLSR